MPHIVKGMLSSGSDGFGQLSWTVKTSISSIVFSALKSICSQSGYVLSVASCHTPPDPRFNPFRSPLFAAEAGNAPEYSEDADAVPPFDARAKFVLAPGSGVGSGVGVGVGEGVGVGPVPLPHASISAIRLLLASAFCTK